MTIVVPTKNSAVTLRRCLESIRDQAQPCRLIVVDNFSTDSTRSIALEFADVVLSEGPERSRQRNVGAAASETSIVGFIDSDMILAPQIVGEVKDLISNGAVSVVIPELTVGEGYWAQVSAFERSFYIDNESIEAPRFFLKSIYQEVGGFDEAMTGGEDWDLALRTVTLGPRARTESLITHDEGRVKFFSLCQKKAYYAPGLVLFARKHGLGALANKSKRPWLKNPKVLLSPVGIGLVLLKTGEALSMVVGIVKFRLGLRIKLPSRIQKNYR